MIRRRWGRPLVSILAVVGVLLGAALALGGDRVAAQADASPAPVVETTLQLTDGTTLRYGIAAPSANDGGAPRPLVIHHIEDAAPAEVCERHGAAGALTHFKAGERDRPPAAADAPMVAKLAKLGIVR